MRKAIYKFGAVWCSPCKAIDPLLDEIDRSVWDVIKIDIEEEPEKAMGFGVRSVPTLIRVDERGAVVNIRTGGINRHQLQEFLR